MQGFVAAELFVCQVTSMMSYVMLIVIICHYIMIIGCCIQRVASAR